jgi:hypothetical protein
VYVNCDPQVWLRCLAAGEMLVPRCANHPQWPGQMHDVTGVPCRNYRPKPAEPLGDIRRIPLGHGQYAIVDAADYEWLNQWKWRVHGGYAMRYEKHKKIFMHRQIMQAPKGMLVDHMDGNPRNNYRSNLRICTPGENARNGTKQTGTSSRFKGVCLRRRIGKWCAMIRFEGRRIYLGCFDDEVEAARAYDRAAVERFGVFARPNFPEDWPVERREEVHAQWLKANGGRKAASPKTRRTRKPRDKRCRSTAVRATRRKTRTATSRTPARRGRKPARARKASSESVASRTMGDKRRNAQPVKSRMSTPA